MDQWDLAAQKRWEKNLLRKLYEVSKQIREKSAGVLDPDNIIELSSCDIIPTRERNIYYIVGKSSYGLQEFVGRKILRKPTLDYGWNTLEWEIPDSDQDIPSSSFEDLQTAAQINTDTELEEETTPGLILKVLSDPTSSLQDRRQIIFDAEACDFIPEREQELMPLLYHFIDSNRDSNNPEDLLAVGSAIRKYVATMDLADVGTISSFLEHTHRYSLPLEIEMELMKMVFRKFAANPPETSDSFPQLSEQIFELASAYLNPRVLRDMHATTAMNAVQALVAMCSKHAIIVLTHVKELPFAWFKQQLFRRLKNLQAEWQGKLSSDHSARRFLDALLSQGEL